MPLILITIVINFFNKQENISLAFLIYLLYLNNCYFNQIMFLIFSPLTLIPDSVPDNKENKNKQ